MGAADGAELGFVATAGATLLGQLHPQFPHLALELADPPLQLLLVAGKLAPASGGGLLGVAQLALGRAQLALGPLGALLGLAAQLELFVLALAGGAQLLLAGLGGAPLVGQRGGEAGVLLLGLAEALLEAVDVAFEGVDGGLGGLGATDQGLLPALGRAAGTAFGEQVGLAAAGSQAALPPGGSFSSAIMRPAS